MHIISLEAENVKRLRAVSIKTNGASAVVIGGRNAQGKTSVIDAIEMALGGKEAIPAEPVRHGARRASIVLDLGEFVVERTFDAKGTKLVVKNAEGVEQLSPQTLLNSLLSKVSFDPFEFSRMDDKKQDAILKSVVGVDFTQLDAKRERAFSARTEKNREVKSLKARIAAMPRHVGALPAVSVAELVTELSKREEATKARGKLYAAFQESEATLNKVGEEISETQGEILRLEEKLKKLRERSDEVLKATEAALADFEAFGPAPNLEEIREQLSTAEERNKIAAEKAAREKSEDELAALERAAEELTDEIESIDGEKKAALEAAQFPVPGLGFNDLGPTLNGVPLSQASQAERLRVSVAIGLALNPKLKVLLVREGALLDEEALQLLAQLAEDAGAQVWVERVGKGDPGAIIIEDGMVENAEAGEAAAE